MNDTQETLITVACLYQAAIKNNDIAAIQKCEELAQECLNTLTEGK